MCPGPLQAPQDPTECFRGPLDRGFRGSPLISEVKLYPLLRK